MIQVRKAAERGHANHGWLDTRYTFSFADYHDENFMGFSVLRVINEDWIAGGAGFQTHGHRDMEIISYVTEGALEHKDSMGNSTIIRPGEVQRMSAGTGVRHSEFNHFKDQKTHLFQIWILPNQNGLAPSYGQQSFENVLAEKNFVLVASREGRDGSVTLNQDVNMYIGKYTHAGEKKFEIPKLRCLWVQMIRGQLQVGSTTLEISDGAAITEEESIHLRYRPDTEFIIFDMPA